MSDPFPHVPNHPNDVNYVWVTEDDWQALLDVAEAAKTYMEHLDTHCWAHDEPLQDALARLEQKEEA